VVAFGPFDSGGSSMPKLYDGWFNGQISKQASSAVSKAISAGKVRIVVDAPLTGNALL